MKQLAIYASGGGSNAQALIDAFRDSTLLRVALVVTNKPQAGVRQRAAAAGIPDVLLQPPALHEADAHLALLSQYSIDYIALAGWLQLLPAGLVAAYRDRILNIHPSLLPAFGGAGMYGLHVHRAVLAAGAAESGCTVHLADEVYDRGRILAQARLPVDPSWTAEALQAQVLQLEHSLYAKTLAQYVETRENIS